MNETMKPSCGEAYDATPIAVLAASETLTITIGMLTKSPLAAKVALAAGIVATIYFLLPASHMSTEPVVIQLCDTICLALYTLKLYVQDNYEETGYAE